MRYEACREIDNNRVANTFIGVTWGPALKNQPPTQEPRSKSAFCDRPPVPQCPSEAFAEAVVARLCLCSDSLLLPAAAGSTAIVPAELKALPALTEISSGTGLGPEPRSAVSGLPFLLCCSTARCH